MGFKKAFSKKLGAITRGFNYEGSSDFYSISGATFQAQISSTGLGSSASISGVNSQLGAVSSGANQKFINQTIATVNTNPSTDEIEQVNVVINRYTDSGYTNLYDSTSLPQPVNLHMYSTALTSLNTVQLTQNFSNSTYSWKNLNGNIDITLGSSYYYDASSGHDLYFWGNNATMPGFPFQNYSNPHDAIVDASDFTPSSSYTDALIELYIKTYNGGAIGIQVVNSSFSSYSLFFMPNSPNWFIATVRLAVGVLNTVYIASFNGNGSYLPTYSATLYNYPGADLGYVQLVGKLSGSF